MAHLFQLIRFLSRSSEKYQYSRASVLMLVLSGVIAGLASTALLAVINATLNGRSVGPLSPGWSFALLCLLLPVARFLSQFLLVRLAQGITYDLRMRLSDKILGAPLRQLEELGAARLLATLTDDVGAITGALTNIPLLSLHLSVILSCLVYMGWLSWQLLLVVLVAVGLGIATYQTPVARALRHFRVGRERWDELFRHFRGLTEGTKELKIHRSRRREFLRDLLGPTAEALRHHNVMGNTIYAVANSWGQILFFVLIGLILFALPGVMDLATETITGYTLVILYMLTPLDVVLNTLPNLSRATVALDKVENLGLSLVEGVDEDGATPELRTWRELQVDGATHTFYREEVDETFTLGPVDLRLTPGELVFIVGGNGSGKTTLAKLLIGLYGPESGELRLDGETVDDGNRDDYRQLFSVVFSDFYLFDVLLGVGDQALDDQARRYLTQLHLDRKVKVEDGRLSTVDLSQGQRKRLALLTAYLEDRPIYLFDEWAADQDPQFKEIFYLQLLPELRQRGKTVLVISHDDRYYGVADRIVKLDYGQIGYDGPVGEYLESLAAGQVPGAAADEPAPRRLAAAEPRG